MVWAQPPIIKVYEALGAIGDGRVRVDGNAAKVGSSDGSKIYEVTYDPAKKAITANDNASYWAGYMGYPSIAYLLASGIVAYNPALPGYLKGFSWKEINTRYKNNFAKSQAFIDAEIAKQHAADLNEFHKQIEAVLQAVIALQLQKLPRSKKPPA